MGWRETWQQVKSAAGNKGFLEEPEQATGLPLGARIGGLVRLPKAPFIQAISRGSFIEMPVDSQNIIKAISRVDLDISGSIYRYYLAVGHADKKTVFLQVYVDAQGEVGDIIYCSQLTRMIPETERDQELFMGLLGYGLGDKSYCLWRDQLEELGYGEADLHAAFGGAEAIEYWRDAGDPEAEFTPPFIGCETRLEDTQGILSLKQQIYYMPYRREIPGDNGKLEYLFIATEVDSSQGGGGKRDMQVDFMVGIAVELEQIAIQ
ncbi:MAG TPA: DUF2491 family protein [Cellvibrio sp.]|nr:DUF2491 family protein [Cellvibrio sp.]